MENVLKNNIKEFLVFLLFNFLLLDNTVALYFLISVFSNPILMSIKELIAFPYFCFVIVNKIFLLPIFYNVYHNTVKTESLRKILHDFRYSWRLKISFLLIIFIIMPLIISLVLVLSPDGYSFEEIFIENFRFNIILGAYQAYLILFLYWWIEDIVLKKKKSSN